MTSSSSQICTENTETKQLSLNIRYLDILKPILHKTLVDYEICEKSGDIIIETSKDCLKALYVSAYSIEKWYHWCKGMNIETMETKFIRFNIFHDLINFNTTSMSGNKNTSSKKQNIINKLNEAIKEFKGKFLFGINSPVPLIPLLLKNQNKHNENYNRNICDDKSKDEHDSNYNKDKEHKNKINSKLLSGLATPSEFHPGLATPSEFHPIEPNDSSKVNLTESDREFELESKTTTLNPGEKLLHILYEDKTMRSEIEMMNKYNIPSYIIIRKPIDLKLYRRFRLFVYSGKLRAISQFDSIYDTDMHELSDLIIKDIKRWYNNICLPYLDVVIDIGFSAFKVILIDMHAFGKDGRTWPILYDWDKDILELLISDEPIIRLFTPVCVDVKTRPRGLIRDSPLSGAKGVGSGSSKTTEHSSGSSKTTEHSSRENCNNYVKLDSELQDENNIKTVKEMSKEEIREMVKEEIRYFNEE